MARILIGIVIFTAVLVAAEAPNSYIETIKAWQKHRDDGLRSEKGWLTLVGLFWLKQGDNTIGSGAKNDMVLPKTVPERVGQFNVNGAKVTFTDASGASKTISYDEKNPDILTANSVSFYVIKRGDKLAVRAKDAANPTRTQFTGMTYYPINPAFRFDAKLIPDVKKVPIVNILGQTEWEESPGVVEFSYQGRTQHLRPIYEDTANGKTLYFLFKDPTNKTATYQAGRMLNVPLPVNGKVDLDFNRSYTPPCTFSTYATCPLPPAENRLTIAIEAGEKRYTGPHPAEASTY